VTDDGSRSINRLGSSRSRYLRQHAGDPVAWHPWGDEAFREARERDVPLFLSIGYSACHWCHVMAAESFADPAVARALNEGFVPVKVDREERPDVDRVYMRACQAMTGSGGWPLTIIATPGGKPFWAGTYLPRESRYGMPGLLDLLAVISERWRGARSELIEAGDRVAATIALGDGGGAREPGEELLLAARGRLGETFDGRNGGFGDAPKFPTPHHVRFLLRMWRRDGDDEALGMAAATLDALARGGIHDRLDSGLHRYATDAAWLVPHFEKMLADQATAVLAFVEGYGATGRRDYAAAAERILSYCERRLRSPSGAFFASEDADSEGEEGRFYTWTRDEVLETVGEEGGEILCEHLGVTGRGHVDGRHVLSIARTPDAIAEERGMTAEAVGGMIDEGIERLRERREERTRPGRDEKILADWNGLAIAAFAAAARALDRPDLAAAATRAADAVLGSMPANGRLLHRDGEPVPGFLDDYAFMAWGLIELYETTFEPRWIARARELMETAASLFGDGEGPWRFAGSDAERLIARPSDVYDGAHDSGNSAAAMNLLRLSRLTGDPALEEEGRRLIAATAGLAEQVPASFTALLCALDAAIGPSREIVVAGPDGPEASAMLREIRRRFLPRTAVLRLSDETAAAGIVRVAPALGGMTIPGEKATAYLCEGFVCREPIAGAAALAAVLDG